MKFLLLIYRDEAAFQAPPPGANHSAPFLAYSQAMEDAGVRLDGNRLQPSAHASTVRVGEGGTVVAEGPHEAGGEQIGGYYLIDAPDMAAALDWAARCPAASQGAVEVRPVVEV